MFFTYTSLSVNDSSSDSVLDLAVAKVYRCVVVCNEALSMTVFYVYHLIERLLDLGSD